MRTSLKPARSLETYALSRTPRLGYSTSANTQATSSRTAPAVASSSHERLRQAAADRDLMLDVLSSTATKRDAKQYLSRFSSPIPRKGEAPLPPREPLHPTGVNLGPLFQTPQAIDASPEFRQWKKNDQIIDPADAPLHTAVVIIRSTSSVDNATLEGVGHTLAQLSRLGLNCMVLVDDDSSTSRQDRAHVLRRQVDRVVMAVEKDRTVRARRLDGLFYSRGPKDLIAARIEVLKPAHIYDAFQRDVVPVTASLIYDHTETVVGANANGATLALAKSFGAGMPKRSPPDSSPAPTKQAPMRQELSLDRVIILDPRGGIPETRYGGSHVFVNLEQEFSGVYEELQELLHQKSAGGAGQIPNGPKTISPNTRGDATRAATLTKEEVAAHLGNLTLTRGVLSALPPTSSALITTPQAAAYSAVLPSPSSPTPGVGTRPQRNPLIHNLLTDKPIFSSSLPRARLVSEDSPRIPASHPSMFEAPPTHLKHGMPVTAIPDPLSNPWLPPEAVTHSLSLDDPRIDIPKLVHLIEDSFGRPLNTEHYFKRIRPILAGIIIAGDYEGGAILTWERPDSSSSSSSFSSSSATSANATANQAPRPVVPYLDKFAVLKRSQGAGGVADVVFSAMVRRCFPDGVCWRSRRGNPVNRWYFERSRGTYKLPVAKPGDQGWTMFWTTDDLSSARFADYASVCSAVESSWADGRKILD